MWKAAAGQAGNVTDRWILHNLNETISKKTLTFEFGVAGSSFGNSSGMKQTGIELD